MATPIKETPILTGVDAQKFIEDKKKNEGKKVDPQKKERILTNFKKFSSIAKFGNEL